MLSGILGLEIDLIYEEIKQRIWENLPVRWNDAVDDEWNGEFG